MNPTNDDSKEMGGFKFSAEDKILRCLIRRDILYDVEVSNKFEIIDCISESAPYGIFRSNKIILHNLRIITDEIVLAYVKK